MLCAAIAAALSTSALGFKSVCPDKTWEELGSPNTKCLKVHRPSEAVSWFAAEAHCNSLGGNLVTVTDTATSTALRRLAGGTDPWIGGIHEGDQWDWADGTALETASVGLLLGQSKFSPRTCLTLKGSDLCGSQVSSYVCQVPVCLKRFNEALLVIDVNFPKQGSVSLGISPTGVFSVSGKDIAVGTWETPNRYSVASPAVKELLLCEGGWLALFSHAGGSATVYTSCRGATLKPAKFQTGPKCTDADRLLERLTPAPHPVPLTLTPVSPAPEPAPIVGRAESAPPSSVPVWVWPLAFIAVAGVSALGAVGALSRKQRRAKAMRAASAKDLSGSDDEELKVQSGSSDTGLETQKKEKPDHPKCPRHSRTTDTCDTCQNFDHDAGRKRLKAVHEQLARDFSLPLVIHDSRCEHIGADHVHIFSVENDFDPSTLGALSTVYSRAKPRLPRSTRIHIRKLSGDGQNDADTDAEVFGTDPWYDGPTYY